MKVALKIALLYVLFSAFYIIISDQLVFDHFLSSTTMHDIEKIQMIKGIIFVIASGLLLYLITNNSIKKLENAKIKRRAFQRFSRNIIASIPDGIGLLNENGDLLTSNKKLNELLPQKDQNEKLKQRISSFLSGEMSNEEHIIKTSDEKWLKISLSKLSIMKGELYTLIRCEDITESKNAHLELLYDKQEFLAILEEVPFGIMLFDLQGCLRFSNKMSVQFNPGFNSNVNLSNLSEHIIPADKATFKQQLKKAISSNDTLHIRSRLQKENGEFLWCHFDLMPVKAEENNGFLLIVTDISVQVSIEEKQELDSDELKNQVQISTQEIQLKNAKLEESHAALKELLNDVKEIRDELIQSNVQLAEANQELEAFSYSVSHDLRAPLRSISGFSQALLEDYTDVMDEKGRDYLQRISNGTVKMSHLIDAMLTLSRISKKAISFGAVNISNLADEIGQDLRKEYPERQVVHEFQKELWCNGDLDLLKILFTNLLSNAWKFTKNQEIAKISIGWSNDEIFVSDNGVGFDEQYKDKIYEPFQRLHNASDFVGSGIGLTIVKRILKRHRGEIRVKSIINGGTTFYIKLPNTEVVNVEN